MTELIKTLNKKNDPDTLIYPNIKAQNIPAAAINSAKLDDNAVSTSKIQDNAVTTDKIASNSITNGKILNGEITNNKLSFHLYEHYYSIRLSQLTTEVRFTFRFTTTDDAALSISDLASIIADRAPTNNYYSIVNINPSATDKSVYVYDNGNGIVFEVLDEDDESIVFSISDATITTSKVKQVF